MKFDPSMLGNAAYHQGIVDTLGSIMEEIEPLFRLSDEVPTALQYNTAIKNVADRAKDFTAQHLKNIEALKESL